ncbi:MGAT2 family protein [Megaselia abdita]
MRARRIQLALPKTGTMYRRRNPYCFRIVLGIFFLFFLIFNLNIFTTQDLEESSMSDITNDSTAAILSMVPSVFHKFLTSKTRNQTVAVTTQNGTITDPYHPPNISEILKFISKYNDLQIVLNEDVFGPLQNDSVIIVIQVHSRITYLRHLIVSLAQAREISRTLLIFSHDFYDEDINDLIQSIDFCKVMQIFYPYSIQTHPYDFPGVDPGDCPRDIKKDQAIVRKCINALHPDLYGHYREAKFTQTKHHWWWKANRVFDQLEITRYHTGLVLFLEEDHYVAEDFLYLLELMQKRALELCPQCNILSLGTYLKTFNYYTYNSRTNRKTYFGQTQLFSSSSPSTSAILGHENKNSINKFINNENHYIRGINHNYIYKYSNNDKLSVSSTVHDDSKYKAIKKEIYNNNSKSNYINNINSLYYSTTNQKFKPSSSLCDNNKKTNSNTNSDIQDKSRKKPSSDKRQAQQTWSYHVLPSLYSIYQKVDR